MTGSTGCLGSGRPLRVLLDGPYGRANLGDNAIGYSMSRFLKLSGVDVTISCIDPDYVEETFGLSAVPMLDFRKLHIGTLRRIGDFDAVVVGGGQQFKEYRVPNPFIGMFARACHMARAARKHDIPFVAWSVGMDWPLSVVAKFMAKQYLGGRNSTLILRDGKSFENAKRLLQGKECTIAESKDAAFMLPAVADEAVSAYCREKYASPGIKRLLVCPSVIERVDGALERLVGICIDASRAGYEVLGWHSEIRPNYDPRVRSMAAWDTIPGFRWLPPEPIDTNEVAALIGSASLVITTRMHPAIIALSQGVAAYGLATNDKMRSTFDELTMPYCNVGEIAEVTFANIVGRDFAPSIEVAAAFGKAAEQGGLQVLEAICSGASPAIATRESFS